MGPNAIAFYDLSGPIIQIEEYSCDRAPGRIEWPLCPRWSDLEAVSGNGQFLGWSDEFDVSWQEERTDGTVRGNRTMTAIVHILEKDRVNGSRGFQAGPAVVEQVPPPTGTAPSRPSVFALRIFDDGSAAAISTQGYWPYPVFLTRAEPDSTSPTEAGRSV